MDVVFAFMSTTLELVVEVYKKFKISSSLSANSKLRWDQY